MPLRLGDRNDTVREWRYIMSKRFSGYARALGPLPTDTNEFGPRAKSWQEEYERRTGQPVDGEVSDLDLFALGVSVSPHAPGPTRWLFTVHGTGMADPLGPGLPADTARACLDKYTWQPIGNYPAAVWPMWPSIQKGRTELRAQIAAKQGEINMAGYSQGAVVVGQVLKHDIIDPAGPLHHRLADVRKVVFWGNPMRQQGIQHDDRWIHEIAPADTHGILTFDLLEGLERFPHIQVRDYAHKGDMYACNTDDQAAEYKRAIARIVMRATDFYGGEDSIVAQLRELAARPLPEMIAAAQAAIQALQFATSTAHGYNIGPAIEFLRS
ncbi:lysin B [Mycobacterium phage Trike]|uniref:lysin B n=1 Tax=Mycobacterium phage Trike TaxID=1527536 RepID=UPI0004EF7F9C|nr:lysin B [Mycobacterium phage Trike]AIK69047.1 lysin B [Mycobacterium phage Trike]